MWYDPLMPSTLTQRDLDTAAAAVAFAQQMRRWHARRTDKQSEQRQDDIEKALERLRDAMTPLKSEIGRFHYGPQTTAAARSREAVLAHSDAIKRERMKLWKMKPKARRPAL